MFMTETPHAIQKIIFTLLDAFPVQDMDDEEARTILLLRLAGGLEKLARAITTEREEAFWSGMLCGLLVSGREDLVDLYPELENIAAILDASDLLSDEENDQG